MTKLAKVTPAPSGRWIDKGCKRVVVVVSVNFTPDKLATVSYRYERGTNSSGLWRRGITPVQTIPLIDWERRFKPQGTP